MNEFQVAGEDEGEAEPVKCLRVRACLNRYLDHAQYAACAYHRPVTAGLERVVALRPFPLNVLKDTYAYSCY